MYCEGATSKLCQHQAYAPAVLHHAGIVMMVNAVTTCV
jgi:hypothetical protein